MADDKNRGGKKQGDERQPEGKKHQGTEATTDPRQPGHAQKAEGREEYRKETR